MAKVAKRFGGGTVTFVGDRGMIKGRMVQKMERVLSSRFSIVKIENTPKTFSVLDRIIH